MTDDELRIMTLEKMLDQEEIAHVQTQANFTTVTDDLIADRDGWRDRYQAMSKQEATAMAERHRFCEALSAIYEAGRMSNQPRAKYCADIARDALYPKESPPHTFSGQSDD